MADVWSEIDLQYMRLALEQAECAEAIGEVPVGAILTVGNTICGRGHNRSITQSDPSAHAEIVAMRMAAEAARNHRLNGATLFVTLEPCAMCVGAMMEARISRLVFALYDRKAGAAGSALDLCADKTFNHRIEVNGGLLADASEALLRRFFQSRR